MENVEKWINECQAYHFGSIYQGARLETIKPISDWQKQAIEKVKTNINSLKGLYLFDKRNRTGKTYMQSAIYAYFLKRGKNQKVFSDIQLEKDLTNNFFNDTWGNVKETVTKTDIFYFKDFGKIAESKDFAMPLLFDFFDLIVSNQKKMIICSNYKPVELAKFENKNWTSIASRIHENILYI